MIFVAYFAIISSRTQKYKQHKSKCGNDMYGTMIPSAVALLEHQEDPVSITASITVARKLGLDALYIVNEGATPTGSMKYYLAQRAIDICRRNGIQAIHVVSSGNHATSIAHCANQSGMRAIVFLPANSSKISHLVSKNTLVVGFKGSIFEDVYRKVAGANFGENVFNANVNNDALLPAFIPTARALLSTECDFLVSGVGNGSYLAGMHWCLQHIGSTMTIVPAGMTGAFPLAQALKKNTMIQELANFGAKMRHIKRAEGSIALASYSMPQAYHAVRESNGFPLGELTNNDLEEAYKLLSTDKALLNHGIIPEPTGIMGLAAVIKYRDKFNGKRVAVAFTGNSMQDLHGTLKIAPKSIARILNDRPYQPRRTNNKNILLCAKTISTKDLQRHVRKWLERQGVLNDNH